MQKNPLLSWPTVKKTKSTALKRIAARRINANVVSFLSRKLPNRVQPKFKDFVVLKYNIVTLCYTLNLKIHHLSWKLYNFLAGGHMNIFAGLSLTSFPDFCISSFKIEPEKFWLWHLHLYTFIVMSLLEMEED